MNARKDRLKSLFAGEGTDGAAETPSPAGSAPPQRATSAAVKAMGLSLGSLSQEADEARRLREMMAAGEQVVELSPDMIERSPFIDRLSDGADNDPEFEALKASLDEHGQQVPVLVRPHPDKAKAARGVYQIAYGHRRVAALRDLGRKVRAVVRDLDDAGLALAQGKENAERRALSFVERAFFARTLLDHGFDRNTAQAALAVHKSEMSRLVQVADAIPRNVARAIGPAPKAGRPRWVALGELLARDKAGFAQDEMMSAAFREAESDVRFQRLFDRLKASAKRRQAKLADRATRIADGQGRQIAEMARSGRAMRITIAEAAGEGFAAFVAERLPELHAAFQAEGKTGAKD
jgi:ParB family chromosome partitioning protein